MLQVWLRDAYLFSRRRQKAGVTPLLMTRLRRWRAFVG